MERNVVKPLSLWVSFWVITEALLMLMGCAHTPTSEIGVPRITKEEVKSMLGNPDVIILDVRATREQLRCYFLPRVTRHSLTLQ